MPRSTEPIHCLGTTPPLMRSWKAEARAARRRDLQQHIAELAVAAGLPLVTAARGRGLTDGFAVGHPNAPACRASKP